MSAILLCYSCPKSRSITYLNQILSSAINYYSFQVTIDLIKSENLKVAIFHLWNELQVCNNKFYNVIADPEIGGQHI